MAAATKVVEVRVHSAKGLRNVAWFGMNQDPYVLVRSLPSGAEAKTESIWGGGTDPKFDPEKHKSRLVMRLPANDGSLVFEVKNKNLVQDELIASGVLDMGVVMDEHPSVQPIELPLHTGGGTLSCTVFRKQAHSLGSDEQRDLDEAIARSMGGGGSGGGGSGGGGGGGDFDWTGGLSTAFGGGGGSGGGGGGAGGNVLGGSSATRDMTADEKRRAAAEAAEARQKNWRQGGAAGGGKEQQAALAERRRKDELMGKIEAVYKSRGQDAPFGLGASSLDALQRHLASLTGPAATAAAARQQKEERLQSAAGLR